MSQMMMRESIHRYFPYEKARDVQEELLSQLEEAWEQYDLIVVNAPTSLGKSALARTLMNWEGSGMYCTPTNQLLTQFLQEFPDTPALYSPGVAQAGRPHWWRWEDTERGQRTARNGISSIACTTSMAVVERLSGRLRPRRFHVIDEAHALIPMLQETASLGIWKHKTGYPDRFWDRNLLLRWAEKELYRSHTAGVLDFLRLLVETLTTDTPQYVIQEIEYPWSGGAKWLDPPVPRSVEVDLPKLVLRPIRVLETDEWARLLGPRVGKVVLLSATLSRVDVDQLRMTGRRTAYMHCISPIPATSRPIIYQPVAAARHAILREATGKMATHIRDYLMPEHAGERGLIHATYQQAEYLRAAMGSLGGRVLYHTADTKHSTLQDFLASPPGTVLVASGMYEGVDLPYDKARWQVICKVPWKSLGDPAIRYQSEQNPEWYSWEALKYLIQACGRVVRAPDDYGTTYILDSTFQRLYNDDKHLAPQWWLDGLVMGDE